MGMKIFGYSPSSLTETSPTETRDLPLFQITGMTESFGAIPICLYVRSGGNWVPCDYSWLA